MYMYGIQRRDKRWLEGWLEGKPVYTNLPYMAARFKRLSAAQKALERCQFLASHEIQIVELDEMQLSRGDRSSDTVQQ